MFPHSEKVPVGMKNSFEREHLCEKNFTDLTFSYDFNNNISVTIKVLGSRKKFFSRIKVSVYYGPISEDFSQKPVPCTGPVARKLT
jgi:hypothetical protein